MKTAVRRAVVVALTTLVALAAVTPASTVDARSRLHKVEPHRMTPYRVGRPMTPNTDILSTSGYAAWMIDEALAGVTPLPRLGSAFMDAERTEGVNARYLVAHALLESGWGTSDIARYKHNLFGYGAADRGPWKYATRFRTYRDGILAVAAKIHDAYLTPGGRWWYGFTTLRAMNMYYASDVHWADKIAVIANDLDARIVTLRERGLRFARPVVAGAAVAGARATLDIRWSARPGAVLPPGIRFAVRWTPVAVVESAATAPARAPRPRWVLAARTDRPGRTVRLAVPAPTEPGVWRLDVEARDSDGRALPPTDDPAVPSLVVRVAGAREARVGIAVQRGGTLAATVANIGRATIGTARAGAATVVEAWALPLDPTLAAYRLSAVPLARPLAPGRTLTVRITTPATPSVVVVRLAGDPGAVGRAMPAAALVSRTGAGRLTARTLSVGSPRDDVLLGRTPPAGRISLRPTTAAGTVEADVTGGTPAPAPDAAVAAVEGMPGRPWLQLRSIAADPWRPATPSASLVELPDEPPTPARLQVSGLAPGVRLVVASVVAPDGTPADPRSLALAWIPVLAIDDPGVVAH